MLDNLLEPNTKIDDTIIVDNIHKNGWSNVGCLKRDYVTEFDNFLDNCQWYPAHVKGHIDSVMVNKTDADCRSTTMHDVILAPHWFEVSLAMTKVVTQYFKTDDIVLYSYNAFYSNPGGATYQGVQNMHSDGDSDNFVGLFMYLTDVNTMDDGPHAFQEKGGNRIEIYGPKGTIFFADTRQPHMGHKPISNPRGLVWARWSLQHNPRTYGIDNLSPIDKNLLGDRYPTDETLRNIIRKVVN